MRGRGDKSGDAGKARPGGVWKPDGQTQWDGAAESGGRAPGHSDGQRSDGRGS